MEDFSPQRLRRMGLPEDLRTSGKALFGTRFKPMEISFEEFSSTVKELVQEVGASWKDSSCSAPNDIFISITGWPGLPAGEKIDLGLRSSYEKHHGNINSIRDCQKVMKEHITVICNFEAQLRSEADSAFEKLIPRVRTLDQMQNLEAQQKSGAQLYKRSLREQGSDALADHVSRLIYRPVSAGSGQLQMALTESTEISGEAIERLDRWLPRVYLLANNLTEEEAFDIAIRNLDRATPENLRCTLFKSQDGIEHYLKTRPPQSIYLTSLHRLDQRYVSINCSDDRALPRMLLPRVVECIAKSLKCEPRSVVIIPWAEDQIFAGCCERFDSMQHLARVSTLRDAKGLVELTPYEVYGGVHGLQKWIDHKPVTMYAVPKTDQDIEDFEKAPTVLVLDESFFMLKHCWQCRKEGTALMKCAKCEKARYCSKACQKADWKSGHRDECEARKYSFAHWQDQPGGVITIEKSKETERMFKKAAKQLRESMNMEKVEEKSGVI
ncbi:hypothetical protein KFL_000360260 [Klebsormidium nitens]|uniref:MYND-type domain-containing protein n=1 Tax=Klebsormidium nitens TaxID=105231 RepID=A0A1Y1HRC1_KLENI|nr:hypothetical protein KFL_000360260 [Klebsormidium nitens]|eukprot:GAQ79709.1 hypothetical protein KFL_000360260 [Klebsormidium nitens]